MPLHEFTCQSCGKRFEKLFRSMSEQPAAACPECGSRKTQRSLPLVNATNGRQSDGGGEPMPFCGRCGGPGPCGMDQ